MIENLMKPRVRVELLYPFSPWEVGEILVMNTDKEWHSITGGYSGTHKRIVGEEINKYPHLFRKLEWWEDREVSEMPEYVCFSLSRNKEVWKVSEYGTTETMGLYCKLEGEDSNSKNWFCEAALTPATLSDYTAYINQTKTTI